MFVVSALDKEKRGNGDERERAPVRQSEERRESSFMRKSLLCFGNRFFLFIYFRILIYFNFI
jgi:hypothetical protein